MREPFEVLRRAKSVRNPGTTLEDLDDLFKIASKWENWSVWVLLAGLALDLALVWGPSASVWTKTGQTIAEGMVVLGVWAEVAMGNAGAAAQGEQLLRSRKQTELAEVRSTEAYRVAKIAAEELANSNKRLAKAEERAAVLEKEAAEARERTAEMMQLTSWRAITDEQRSKLSEALRPYVSEIDMLIEFQRSDPEAYLFAGFLQQSCAEAGVEKMRDLLANEYLSGKTFGVWVAADNKDIAEAVAAVLPFTHVFDAGPMSAFRPMGGHPTPNVYVFVAPRVPPNMIKPDSAG